MTRLIALGSVLLLAASYLLFGVWWVAPAPGPEAAPADDANAARGPELAVTSPRPLDVDAEAQRLLEKLKSLDAAGAARQLGAILAQDTPGTLPFHAGLAAFLADLLGTAERRLSGLAIHFLQHMGPEAAPYVTALLTEGVTPARRAAAFSVIEFWHRNGHVFEMPPLLPFLLTKSARGRQAVLRLIRRGVPYDGELAVYLLDLLRKNADSFVPGRALARMGPQGVALLVEMTAAASMRERLAAFHSLGHASPEHLRPHLPMLTAVIGDEQENPSVRIAAIFALRAMRGDCVDCLPVLRIVLSPDTPEYLNSALSVLGPMGPRAADAVPELLAWLDEGGPRQGDQVATVLGKIRSHPDRVLAALAGVIEERGSDAAAIAMAAFGTRAYGHAVRILEVGDEYAQYSILMVFAQLGERAAPIVPKLIPLIGGEDEDITKRVIGTLGYIGPKAEAAVPAIMKQLAQGEDVLSPHAAAGTLARLGPAAERALAAALRSANEVESRQAVRVLAKLPVRTAFVLDELEALAKSKDARVRAEALEAIGISVLDPMDPTRVYPPARNQALVGRVRAIMVAAEGDDAAPVRECATRFLGLLDLLRRVSIAQAK